MSLVKETVKPATGKARVSYGIIINVGSSKLNEWGLSENEAKEVHELLVLNNEQPLPPTSNGIIYSRRPASDVASELAALRAKLQPVQV